MPDPRRDSLFDARLDELCNVKWLQCKRSLVEAMPESARVEFEQRLDKQPMSTLIRGVFNMGFADGVIAAREVASFTENLDA